jgi:hypothetical protein
VTLPQEVVAELAGATRPTVNQVLRGLQDRAVVNLGRGRIEIVDAEAFTEPRTVESQSQELAASPIPRPWGETGRGRRMASPSHSVERSVRASPI